MNPLDVQNQVVKKLKITKTHFSKIIKMVESQTPSGKILTELHILRKQIMQTTDLVRLPNIARKIDEGKLDEAAKELNPFS